MILADFHVHSNFSPDSKTNIYDQIISAVDKNLKYICLTDHVEFPDFGFQNYVQDYFKELNDLKAEFKSKINILIGAEVSLDFRYHEQISDFLQKHKFDFVIASQHSIRFMPEQDVFYNYFEDMLKNLTVFTDYNVVGHLDYVIRYAPNQNKNFDPDDYFDLLTQIFKIIIKQNKGIEINTSGFRRDFMRQHPHEKILQLYKKLGGKIITIGSDAHNPDYIAYEFNKICNLLKKIGFDSYTVFQNQVPKFIKI